MPVWASRVSVMQHNKNEVRFMQHNRTEVLRQRLKSNWLLVTACWHKLISMRLQCSGKHPIQCGASRAAAHNSCPDGRPPVPFN